MPPGFSQFLSNRGYLHPFWDGTFFMYGVGERPRTLTELAMCNLSGTLRQRPDWWVTYPNQTVEDLCSGQEGTTVKVKAPVGEVEVSLTAKQVQYVLDELAGYATLRAQHNEWQVSCFERIWESTSLLTAEQLQHLTDGFELLRHDYRLRYRGKRTSVDLVDPFMHGLVYGLTPAYGAHDTLHIEPPPLPLISDWYAQSPNFAFIPTSFKVSMTDKPLTVKAQSYINDIYPSVTGLYPPIESTLASTIPVFEYVLTDLHRTNPLRQRIRGSCRYTEWDEPDEPEHSDDEEGWMRYEREVRQWTLHRPLEIPDIPGDGYIGGLEKRNHYVSLRGRTVKVVVKVTDIHLDAESPTYEGTPWHVAGMRNERIVACTLCCLSMSNMKPPEIEFRMPVCSPRNFLPGDEGATFRTWGLSNASPSNQYLGSVPLKEHLTIGFPNIYQHRFTPCTLENTEIEGFMRILSFFMVDPDLSNGEGGTDLILSSSDVPPQSKAWMRRAVEESIDFRLPNEVIDRILDFVKGVMTEEEAREYATRMRKERERFWSMHDERWFCLPFDTWSGAG